MKLKFTAHEVWQLRRQLSDLATKNERLKDRVEQLKFDNQSLKDNAEAMSAALVSSPPVSPRSWLNLRSHAGFARISTHRPMTIPQRKSEQINQEALAEAIVRQTPSLFDIIRFNHETFYRVCVVLIVVLSAAYALAIGWLLMLAMQSIGALQ